jgi:hypothetical protein
MPEENSGLILGLSSFYASKAAIYGRITSSGLLPPPIPYVAPE